jgi:phage gpG-like protein
MPRFDFSNWQPFIQVTKRAATVGVQRMAERVVRHVQESFPAVGKYGTSPVGTPPAKHLGALRDSITYEMRGPIRARVGSSIKYGPVHEFGQTIRPKVKQYLRVAVNNAARELNLQNATLGLRQIGPFRLFKSRKGNLMAVGVDKVKTRQYVTGPDGKRRYKTTPDIPVFVLKKFVRMPKRPFMAPALAWSRNNAALQSAFVRGLKESLKESGFSITVRGVK